MVNCRRYSAETDRIAPNDNHCCRSPQTRDMQRLNTARAEKPRHVFPRLGALTLGTGALARAKRCTDKFCRGCAFFAWRSLGAPQTPNPGTDRRYLGVSHPARGHRIRAPSTLPPPHTHTHLPNHPGGMPHAANCRPAYRYYVFGESLTFISPKALTPP